MNGQRRCGICIQLNTTQLKKQDERMPFAAIWMDQDIIILTEVSQTEKDKYNITYRWDLKKKKRYK